MSLSSVLGLASLFLLKNEHHKDTDFINALYFSARNLSPSFLTSLICASKASLIKCKSFKGPHLKMMNLFMSDRDEMDTGTLKPRRSQCEILLHQDESKQRSTAERACVFYSNSLGLLLTEHRAALRSRSHNQLQEQANQINTTDRH